MRRLPGPVFLVLGFLLVSAPYLIQVQRIEGRWMPGEKGALNFFLTHRAAYEEEGLEVTPSDHDAITGADTPRRPGDYRVLEFLQRRPGHVLRHTARNLPEALFSKIPSLVYVPFVLLALFGLVSRRVVARSRFEWLFLAWIVALALCMSPLFLLRRFFVATLPLFLVWGAVGVEELRHRVSRRVFVSLVVAWSLFFAAYTHQTLAKRRPPVLYKQAGLWLRDHAGSDLVLTGRKPEPAFYAEALFVPLEARSVEALREGMRQQGVTHLIVDDYVFTRSHPALAHLMDVAQAPAWLRHVRTAADEEHRVLVYAFREP